MLRSTDESRRLNVLRRFSILDTAPDEVFDRIARMASGHFRTPIGTVTFVDDARQWFKAIHGIDLKETGRDVAFCNFTIMADQPLLIADALADARVKDNPLVQDWPNIRFYIGAPLVTSEGLRLGTVSAIDVVPRLEFGPEDCRYLSDLAAMAAHELEMRLAASDLKHETERRIHLEARHRAVIDAAADAMVVTDETGVIIHFNPAAERIFGFRAQEAIGRDLSILMPGPDQGKHEGYIGAYLKGGKPKVIGIGREVIGQRKDGTLVPLDLSVAEWSDGSRRYFTGIMRDITSRKNAEAALKTAQAERAESLALLQTIIEGIPDALFFKDRDGRYVIANTATAKALMADRVVGLTDFEILTPEKAIEFRKNDFEVMATNAPVTYEETLDAEGGTVRWFLTSKFPIRNQQGQVIGVVGLARDITERRAMIQQLRASRDQAEAAVRAKTAFLAAASHDLRQPVQALELFMSALEGRLNNGSAANVVDRMKQSIDALQMLLESILEISKLDAGAVEAKREPCNLADLVDRLAAEYAPQARSQGLELRTAGLNYWTHTDEALLERVLRKLVENALRFTKAGRILIGCRRQGDHIGLQVIDSGIGVPQDQLEHIFQEFVQLGNPERDRAKGLGLGLSIARRLLHLLGHELTIQSKPGRGACFSIALPILKEVGTVPLPPSTNLGTERPGGTVLVIDDEAIVRLGLEMLLADWGFAVLPAANQEEALARVAESGTPDLVIADYRLQEDRTGTEAVAEVQQVCGRKLPTIIITGDTAPERIAEVHRSGYTIAHKPIAGDSLRKLVSNALAGRA